MITLHPSGVIKLLDRLGEGYDEPVMKWREKLISRVQMCIDTQHVRYPKLD